MAIRCEQEFNKYTTDSQMRFQPDNVGLDSTMEIECSVKNSKPMRTSKKQKMQEKISALLKASSSLRSLRKESSPGHSQKIHSIPVQSPTLCSSSQKCSVPMPLIRNTSQEKYSKSLFSTPSISTSNSKLGQQQHFHSPVSATIFNQSVSSQQRLGNIQIDLSLGEQLNNEWSNLTQQLTPMNASLKSQHQRNISQNKQHSHSPLSATTLNRSFVSSVSDTSLYDSRTSDLNLQIHPIQRCISRETLSSHSSQSYVTMKQLEERRSQNSESDLDSHVQGTDIWCDVQEQMKSSNVHQNYLAEQNRNMSMQIQNFEWYVRDKIEQTEKYMKQQLSQLEDANGIIIETLKDIKRLGREQPVQINKTGPGKLAGFAMPKIPISKPVSLVLLNIALQNSQYMEQFVTEISHVVTLYVYNPRKSVKSIMKKLFTLNLLIKYSWSHRKIGIGKPEFSALTGVLRAINRLLTNYMSDRDIRREIKLFFQQIPQIYEKQSIRYF